MELEDAGLVTILVVGAMGLASIGIMTWQAWLLFSERWHWPNGRSSTFTAVVFMLAFFFWPCFDVFGLAKWLLSRIRRLGQRTSREGILRLS